MHFSNWSHSYSSMVIIHIMVKSEDLSDYRSIYNIYTCNKFIYKDIYVINYLGTIFSFTMYYNYIQTDTDTGLSFSVKLSVEV